MGREIVYCEGCGKRLTEDDFDRGKAQTLDHRHYCSSCRPVTAPPPAPRPAAERATERRGTTTSKRKSPTGWVPRVPPPAPEPRGKEGRVALIAGGALAAVAVIIIAVSMAGGKPAEPVASRPPPEPREDVDARLRELEALAAAVSDPEAVLVRCDQLRATFRGAPQEARFKQLEFRALERKQEKERSVELDRSLAALRKIMQEDPEGARRVDVESQLDAALKKAGPRSGEVAKLRAEYRAQCELAAKTRESAKAPPREWAQCFLLAGNKIQANDYPAAKVLYLEGLATLPPVRPEDLKERFVYCAGLYNLACVLSVGSAQLKDAARKEAQDDAFKYLEGALRSDYGRFRCPCHPQAGGLGHMAEDKDMEPIRADPRYAALLGRYK
jgi:hypothetical protein